MQLGMVTTTGWDDAFYILLILTFYQYVNIRQLAVKLEGWALYQVVLDWDKRSHLIVCHLISKVNVIVFISFF